MASFFVKIQKLKEAIKSAEHLLNRKFGLQIIDTEGKINARDVITNEIAQKTFTFKSIPDAAFEVMSETKNEPMHIKQIFQQIIAKGKKISHTSSIGVSLKRDPRFMKIGPNVFMLAEKQDKKGNAS